MSLPLMTKDAAAEAILDAVSDTMEKQAKR